MCHACFRLGVNLSRIFDHHKGTRSQIHVLTAATLCWTKDAVDEVTSCEVAAVADSRVVGTEVKDVCVSARVVGAEDS